MVHRGTFLQPLALDYIKGLKVLLGQEQHLDSLDEGQWMEVMGMCWAAGLGRRLDRAQEWGGEEGEEDEGDVEMQRDDRDSVGTGTGRTTPKPALTMETTEMMSLIPLLLSTAHAPLLSRPGSRAERVDGWTTPRAGLPILRDSILFLETHRSESSAHRSVLAGLALLLPTLELNYTAQMRTLGARLVPLLVNLLTNTRGQDVREDVFVCLDTLLPWVFDNRASSSRDTAHHGVFASETVGEAVRKLVDVLGKDLAGAAGGGLGNGQSLSLGGLRCAFETQRRSVKGKEKETETVVLAREDPLRARLVMVGRQTLLFLVAY